MYKMSASILLVVASVVVLVAGDCIQRIRDIEEKTKTDGRPLIGGYRPVEDTDTEKKEVVKKIVADSINTYNARSNDLIQYEDNGNYVAYSQLVNGENYCCQFQIKSIGCKNGINGDFCQKEKTLTCSVEAYKAFTAQYATTKPESVQCTDDVVAA